MTGRGAARAATAAAALLAALLGLQTGAQPADLSLFAAGGRDILAGHLARVYASPVTEAGPLQLLLSRWLAADGAVPARWEVALLDAALVLGLLSAARAGRGAGRAGGPPAQRRPLWPAAAATGYLLAWLAGPAFWAGHPVEVLVPICWTAATALARRGRRLPAVALMAAAAGVAPWAVLGLPCLLAAGPLRRGLASVAAAGVAAAALYLPFLATGHFAAAAHRWPVAGTSLVHLLAPGLPDAGWPVRLVQGAVVTGGCALVALRGRQRASITVVAPLVAALLRVATDPVQLGYYWVPVAACVAVLLATATGRRPRAALLVLAYLPWSAVATGWTVPSALAALVALAVLLRAPQSARSTGRSASSTLGSSMVARHRPVGPVGDAAHRLAQDLARAGLRQAGRRPPRP